MQSLVWLSVVIPAYNEGVNLDHISLESIFNFLQKFGQSFELILADDGSTDKTVERFRAFAKNRPQVKVLQLPHRGKGPTLREALLEAQGSLRLFTDLDQSTPIETLLNFLPEIDAGYDIVIGSRELKKSKRENEPWYRHLMGKVFNLVVRIMTIPQIRDTQCGFKLITARVADDILPRLKVTMAAKNDPFTGAMDVELLYLANRARYLITEVAVEWKHVKSERVAPIKDSLRMFWEVVLIRVYAMSGKYD